jgi:hypothetical protein
MVERIRQLLHEKPFHPFRIVMKSGERHDVVDPEKIAIGQNQLFLYSGRTEKMTWLKVAEVELVYAPLHQR